MAFSEPRSPTNRSPPREPGRKDYRAEIEAEVIDPCYLAIIRRQEPVEGVSNQQMLELLKIVETANVTQMVQTLLPVVTGKTRTHIYELGKMVCINSSKQ